MGTYSIFDETDDMTTFGCILFYAFSVIPGDE